VAGLVDAIKDENELEGWLRGALGRASVSLRDPDPAPLHPEAWPTRRVGVVLVDGAIVDGPSEAFPFGFGSLAGSDTLVAALDELRRDRSVRAVVLRVNSPGGSAFASDVIARAVRQVRQAGKPVVVSMGDMAASGGYYIAAPADLILAEPSTLSGSIGIFGYKADVRKLMGMVGLATETFRRGQHADYFSPYRPWTDEEIRIAGDKIRHFYGLFLSTVAEGRRGRGLTLARVDQIGRGHVWTGAQALGLGLVDQMGGLADAIDQAARLGHVPLGRDRQPEIAVLPRSRASLVERLAGVGAADEGTEAQDAEAALVARLLRAGGAAAMRLLAPLLAGGGHGIEARLPYDLEIR
jgi:protease IV